jgi:hypothetical protein
MGKNLRYKSGDPWTDCDRCGFTYRMSQVRKEYTGLMVCDKCYETRHPQEFVYVQPEQLQGGSGSGDWGRERFIRTLNEDYLTEIPPPTVGETVGALLLESSTVLDVSYLLQEDGSSKIQFG